MPIKSPFGLKYEPILPYIPPTMPPIKNAGSVILSNVSIPTIPN